MQSRLGGGGVELERPQELEPLGQGASRGGLLFRRAAEVVGLSLILLATLGYGLWTSVWWPAIVASVGGLAVVVLRRS
ncbi:MAG: hypothetical protein KKB70_02490 [Proteobacteria bacterium]|nr:hypothetical protein [Pseudomonadota bacterium]MBU1611179.1 hypothetical protein [Pseudomonadota bacterium]